MLVISNQIYDIVEKIANDRTLTRAEAQLMSKWTIFKLRTDHYAFFNNNDAKNRMNIHKRTVGTLEIHEIQHNNPSKVTVNLTAAMQKTGINPNSAFTLPTKRSNFMLIPKTSRGQEARLFAELQDLVAAQNNSVPQNSLLP